MTDTPVRWAILGAGIIAHRMADAINQSEGGTLVAVASKTAEKAKTFAQEYRIEPETYDGLMARSDIDIVYIATTHNFHYDNALMALKAGKNAVIEKPFTVNAHQAKTLIEYAREKQLFLMEAIWTRFLPSVQALKESLGDPKLGPIKTAHLNFGGVAPEHYRGRLLDPALAGGVTLDMGVYPVSLLCYVLGQIPEVISASAQFSDTGVDETASYQLRFPSGCLATINTSFNLLMPHWAGFYAEGGYIEFPHFQQAERFHVQYRRGAELTHDDEVSAANAANGFIYQAEEAARCVRDGKTESDTITLDETLAIMRLLDDIRTRLPLTYEFEQSGPAQ